jgi:CBS domain-containing protein
MLTTTVAQILAQKGTAVFSVPPDMPVLEALAVMAEKNVGALLVVEADRVVGILSERDYARKVMLLGRSSRETPVREIMSERVLFVGPEQTAEECMAVMSDKHVRHLPVLGDGRPIGVISIGDVVKAVIAEQHFAIQQLENYISGGR